MRPAPSTRAAAFVRWHCVGVLPDWIGIKVKLMYDVVVPLGSFGGIHELLPCRLLGGVLVKLFRKSKSKYYWYDRLRLIPTDEDRRQPRNLFPVSVCSIGWRDRPCLKKLTGQTAAKPPPHPHLRPLSIHKFCGRTEKTGSGKAGSRASGFAANSADEPQRFRGAKTKLRGP